MADRARRPPGLRLRRLARRFYNRDTVLVARELLGKYLVVRKRGVTRIGRIVETEAYLGPHDLAAHSARGLTPRTRVMFGPPGHAYVYLVYGMHHCMNVVTEREGHASAVLIRALEPISNVKESMSGPALLCRALRIDRRDSGRDLLSAEFHVAVDGIDRHLVIVKRPRIGVDYAGAWAKRLLRFYIRGNEFVSRA